MHDFHKLSRRKLEAKPIANGRPCCADTNNLRYSFSDNNVRDRIVLRCKVCHAKHIRFMAEGGKLGLTAMLGNKQEK